MITCISSVWKLSSSDLQEDRSLIITTDELSQNFFSYGGGGNFTRIHSSFWLSQILGFKELKTIKNTFRCQCIKKLKAKPLGTQIEVWT